MRRFFQLFPTPIWKKSCEGEISLLYFRFAMGAKIVWTPRTKAPTFAPDAPLARRSAPGNRSARTKSAPESVFPNRKRKQNSSIATLKAPIETFALREKASAIRGWKNVTVKGFFLIKFKSFNMYVTLSTSYFNKYLSCCTNSCLVLSLGGAAKAMSDIERHLAEQFEVDAGNILAALRAIFSSFSSKFQTSMKDAISEKRPLPIQQA